MPLSLDGSNTAHSGGASSLGITLTTSTGSGIIKVATLNNAGSTTTVSTVVPSGTGAGNVGTFTLRARAAATNPIEIWSAPYTGNFAGTITVTWSASGFVTLCTWGEGGASGFDTGAPQTSTTTTASVTTTNANDFVAFASGLGGGGTDTAGTGWTTICGSVNTGQFLLVGYQIVSATGTYTSSDTGGILVSTVIDASKQAIATAAIGTTIILMGVG